MPRTNTAVGYQAQLLSTTATGRVWKARDGFMHWARIAPP